MRIIAALIIAIALASLEMSVRSGATKIANAMSCQGERP
jgi:hypothetical protein